MKLYVAHCEDRHIDPVIRVFSAPDAAISFARDFMDNNMAHPEDIQEAQVAGYLLCLRYGVEGDKSTVQEITLDDAS